MRTSTRSRLGLVSAAVVLASTTLALGATPALAHKPDPLVGTWSTTLTVNTNPPAQVTLIFKRNHSLTLIGAARPDGTPAYIGTGRWDCTATGFHFTVTHPLPDANGTVIGTVKGEQAGTVSGDAFASTGTSFLHKLDGTVLGPNTVTMTGTLGARVTGAARSKPAALLAVAALTVTGALAIAATTRTDAPEANASESPATLCYVRTGYQSAEKTVRVSRRTANELLTKTASYRGPCSLYGPPSALGNGAVRTYAQLDGGRPLAIGVTFPATTLANLPTPPTDGLRCFDVDSNGSIDAHAECVGGHERPLELPAGLASRTSTSLKWALVNWNTHGHGPPGIYDTPHLDFHFYVQPRAERDAIRLGPCGIAVHCDDFATGRIPIPAQYLPRDYADLGAVEAKMGNHLVDQSGPEFHGELFTHSFIYGAYAGKVSFLEPMVSLATFQRLQAGPEREICQPIKQPTRWLEHGWYPRTYCLRYRENRGDFTVSLEDFRRG